MPSLYFTKFTDWDKHVLTEEWFNNANQPDRLNVKPIGAYQIRDFAESEFNRIMTLPFNQVLDQYFPNI